MTPPTATVFLVGAGPGDPGLITVRGLELVRSADVVLYDRLVDPRLVDEAPASAERIFVGKKPGAPSLPQAEIDALIVEGARGGRRVVRLKGGDPFVFGRGADEAQALVAAGVTFEIVPGVSSVVAVPAYAGIPVTHSGASSSFAVMTAHESSLRPGAEERWNELARSAGTLIFVMGVGSLAETARRLVEAGREPDEPTAVIERGTTRDQRTIVATLGTIAEAARDAEIASPAITIVGQVVRLREALSWYESKPLFGRRIVLTRPRAETRELRSQVEALGADVVAMSMIDVVALEDSAALDESLNEGGFDWIAFASHNAVESVLARLRFLGKPVNAKAAAVGPRTAAALGAHGVTVDVVAETASGAGLATALGPGTGRILVPVSEGRVSRAADELERLGWNVVREPAYRTVPLHPGTWQRELVENGDFDALVFASGSAVEAFAAAFGSPDEIGLGPGADSGRRVVAAGPTTAASLADHGMRVDEVAGDPSAHGLVHALLEALTA